MPPSVERPRLSTGGGAQSAQVATSNSTLNKFLGGPRRSWMTDVNADLGTSAPVAAQTTANKERPTIPRERARREFNIQVPALQNVVAPNTAQTTGLPTPNDTHIDEDPQNYPQRGGSVLPSPALTNEASPVTTGYGEANGFQNAVRTLGPPVASLPPNTEHAHTQADSQKRPAPSPVSSAPNLGPKRICQSPQGLTLPEAWINIIGARIDACQAQSPTRQSVERPRYRMLQDACVRGDLFYIILHQHFCWWTLDRPALHQRIAASPEAIDAVFETLLVLLRRNDDMPKQHLEWFAEFPGDFGLYLREYKYYADTFFQFVTFLRTFSQTWDNLASAIHARRYPVLAWEASYLLKCPSPILQSVIFTFTRRLLHVQEGLVARELNDLFAKDQLQEYQMATDNVAQEWRTKARDYTASKYSAVMAHAQRSQASPVTSSSPTFTPVHPSQGTIIHPPPVPRSDSTVGPQPVATAAAQPLPGSVGPAYQIQQHHQVPAGPYAPAFLPVAQGLPIAQGQQVVQQQTRMPHRDLQASMPHSSRSSTGAQPRPIAINTQIPPYAPPQQQQQQQHQQQQQQHQHQQQQQQQHQHAHHHQRHGATRHRNSYIPSQSPDDLQPLRRNANYNAAPVAQTHSLPAAPASSHPGMATTQNYSHRGIGMPLPPNSAGVTQSPAQYRIPENDYPASPYDWTSVQPSLHLVNLRSPQRAPTQPASARHYQFISNFATELMAVPPQSGLRTLSFRLSDMEFADLAVSRTCEASRLPFAMYSNGSCRYRLRFCLFKASQRITREAWAVLPNHWPEHIYIMVNGKPQFPRRKQHFHHDLPIELTDAIQPGPNTVAISLPDVNVNSKKDMVGYMAVEVVRTIDHDSAMAMVKRNPCIPADQTKKEIQRRLQVSDSDDIIVEDDSLTVSLADPFSSTMFDVPVRGNDCRHLECFDLDTWLRTRPAKSPSRGKEPSMVDVWKCPICGLDARPCSLRIDDYFTNVRTELLFKGQERTKRIKVYMRGDWVPIIETEDSEDEGPDTENAKPRVNPRPSTKRPLAEVIEILDD